MYDDSFVNQIISSVFQFSFRWTSRAARAPPVTSNSASMAAPVWWSQIWTRSSAGNYYCTSL